MCENPTKTLVIIITRLCIKVTDCINKYKKYKSRGLWNGNSFSPLMEWKRREYKSGGVQSFPVLEVGIPTKVREQLEYKEM